MQYDKPSPSNTYVDVDGVATPIEDLEPAVEPTPEPEQEQKPPKPTKGDA